ncbi:HNH endonuclease [Bdellovibrio bacteriovorus]|uniref:HNH endonuclease n=1 Tax=Bdellovibrio bacteriovorus TaxID=959 RepID=UPI0035A92FD2
MNIKFLSDENLEQSLKCLVQKEREVLADILQHIAEVDRRKLYLSKAYPSLFDYLTKCLGYSAGSAQRRIDAARLCRDIPEVTESLESGSLSLSQVSLLQKAIRQNQKEARLKIPLETKKDILNEMFGKSYQESEVLVARALNIEIKQAPKIQYQADESIRFEVSFTKDQWQKMEEMRTLLSHSLPKGSWDQVLEFVAEKVIQQKSLQSLKKERKKNAVGGHSFDCKATDEARLQKVERPENIEEAGISDLAKAGYTNEFIFNQRRYIPLSLRRAVFQRNQCCQHIDKKTGKRCSSRWQLQIDHIQPVWAGGSSAVENLQLLCSAHNRMKYHLENNLRPV